MAQLVRRLVFLVAVLVIACGVYIAYVLATLPDVESLNKKNPSITALMEQRAAEKNTKARPIRTWVSYRNISPHLRNAVVVSEDGAFFDHSGVDLYELKESIKRNLNEGRFARGASTITQQLAKNLYLSTSKSPLRKVREFFIARQLEEHVGKQRILELYLNVIEWGNGIYGIGAAAQAYFGKTPSELRPEEAAVLAAMIPTPRSYSPARGTTKYLQTRKDEVLRLMVRYRYLEPDDYDEAMSRSVDFHGKAPGGSD